MKRNNHYFLFPFLISLIAAIILLILNNYLDGNTIWTGKLGNGGLYAEYCELNQFDKFLRQPMNSYSNLAFLFFGVSVIRLGFRDMKSTDFKNPLMAFSAFSILQGIYFCYLFLGSTYYHASLTWTAQRVDMNATYSIAISLIGISCYRLFIKTDASNKFKAAYVLLLFFTVLVFIEIYLYTSSFVLLPLLILVIIICTITNYLRNKEKYNLYLQILSLLFMITAFILRTLDVNKIGCDPASVYQGHSLWHLFTGMSVFLLYWFYRSEKA